MKQLRIAIHGDAADFVRALAKRRGCCDAEVVGKALEAYRFLVSERELGSAIIVERGGKLQELVGF